jgi:hypothetical protein
MVLTRKTKSRIKPKIYRTQLEYKYMKFRAIALTSSVIILIISVFTGKFELAMDHIIKLIITLLNL